MAQFVPVREVEYEVPISRTKSFVCHVRCYNIWLAECRRLSARPQPKVLETHCRKCDELLEQYSNAVESFALAVKDYWSRETAGTFLCAVTEAGRRRKQRALMHNRKALMEHYAFCARHKASLVHHRATPAPAGAVASRSPVITDLLAT